jgi:hypothetical protein
MHSNKGGFATGSQLLATVEKVPLTTNAQRNAYFQQFLKNEPVRTCAIFPFLGVCQYLTQSLSLSLSFIPNPCPPQLPTLGNMQARLISKDVASLAGTWSFTFKDDRSKVIPARVTMIWKKYPKVPGSNKRVRRSAPRPFYFILGCFCPHLSF